MITRPFAFGPEVKFLKDGQVVDSITCGETFTIKIEGYSEQSVWVDQKWDDAPRYSGVLPVPLTHSSSCDQEEGVYDHVFYEYKSGSKGEEIGKYKFTINPFTKPPEEQKGGVPVSCSLSIEPNKENFEVDEEIKWQISSTPENLDAYWFGTGLNEAEGLFAGKTPYTFQHRFQGGDLGTWRRYAKIKNEKGEVVCETPERFNITVSKPAPTPTPTPVHLLNALKPDTNFRWTGLEGGLIKSSDGKIKYKDFALSILSTNSQPTQVTINISGPSGVRKSSETVTLEKDKTHLWIADQHFPVDSQRERVRIKALDEELNFDLFNNFVVTVTASAPVYTFPPTEFRADGEGADADTAVKNGWWGSWKSDVGYAVEGNRYIFPYAIHWHNFDAWAEGWNTVITAKNKSNQDGVIRIANKSVYNNIQDHANNCADISLPDTDRSYGIGKIETKTILLSEFLGVRPDQSHNAEGSLIVTVPDVNFWEVSTEVISIPSGKKLCPQGIESVTVDPLGDNVTLGNLKDGNKYKIKVTGISNAPVKVTWQVPPENKEETHTFNLDKNGEIEFTISSNNPRGDYILKSVQYKDHEPFKAGKNGEGQKLKIVETAASTKPPPPIIVPALELKSAKVALVSGKSLAELKVGDKYKIVAMGNTGPMSKGSELTLVWSLDGKDQDPIKIVVQNSDGEAEFTITKDTLVGEYFFKELKYGTNEVKEIENAKLRVVLIPVPIASSITAGLSPATPFSKNYPLGTTNVEFSRFRLSAAGEGFFLERLGLFTETNGMKNIKSVKTTYKDKSGAEKTSSTVFDSNGLATFGFTGNDRLYIPKDSSAYILITADLRTKAEGGDYLNSFGINLRGSQTRVLGESTAKVVSLTSDIIANMQSTMAAPVVPTPTPTPTIILTPTPTITPTPTATIRGRVWYDENGDGKIDGFVKEIDNNCSGLGIDNKWTKIIGSVSISKPGKEYNANLNKCNLGGPHYEQALEIDNWQVFYRVPDGWKAITPETISVSADKLTDGAEDIWFGIQKIIPPTPVPTLTPTPTPTITPTPTLTSTPTPVPAPTGGNGTIVGRIVYDANSNKKLDDGEKFIQYPGTSCARGRSEAVGIKLYKDSTNTFDLSRPSQCNPEPYYIIENVPAGTYKTNPVPDKNTIVLDLPPGWIVTDIQPDNPVVNANQATHAWIYVVKTFP